MGASMKIERPPEMEVLGLLAEGGMSEVYLGRRAGSTELVVLKRLPPEHSKDASLLRMFRDEARISRLVSGHPNVVRYLEEGELDGSRFIAFELVEGLTVAEILNRSASRGLVVPPSVVVLIGVSALEGLAHAHAATDEDGKPLGLIHRDVTPQNIVVTWDGQVKLLDFGVSKSAGRTLVTAPGLIKGKPYFMAPEQLRIERLDHRVDLFALGVVLYFLLTLRHPFEGHNDMNVLAAMAEGNVTSPLELVPSLPPRLASVLLKALEANPDERFGDAMEMKAALLDSEVAPANVEDVMMFLSDLSADVRDDRLGRVPSMPGVNSWNGVRMERPEDLAALSMISMPYRVARLPSVEPPKVSDEEDTAEGAGVGLAEPSVDPEPAARPPGPQARTPRTLQLELPTIPSRGQRAVWGLVWLLAGVLFATWMLRLLALTPRPALIVDSDPPGATVYVESREIPGRTPIVVQQWPGAGPIVVRWALRDHEDCRTVLEPADGRTVRAQCRMRRSP